MSRLLEQLAQATDTKGYPDDKNPENWRTIRGAKVHLNEAGHIDGGAGGKFKGKRWTSPMHPHKTTSARAAAGGIAKSPERGVQKEINANNQAGNALSKLAQAASPAQKTQKRTLPKNTALGQLAAATKSAYNGASKYGGCPPNATSAEISEWRKTYPTLKNFEGYAAKNAQAIEQSFIRDGISKKELDGFKKDMQRLIDKSDFAMQMPSNVLFEKVMVPNGKFKTQFETGTSNVTVDQEFRASAANKMFDCGAGVNAVPKEAREKYGFLISKDIKDEAHPYDGWYGDCLIRFKKDKLKGKVTFNVYDSGDNVDYVDHPCAGDADNVSMAGFGAVHPADMKKFIERAKTAKSVSEVLDYEGGYDDRYFELQYHEDNLTMDCVDSVTFLRPATNKPMLEKLKAMGVKCYAADGTIL